MQQHKLWQVEHDTKIEALWDRQHEWNDEMREETRDLRSRINKTDAVIQSFRFKITWLCGLAAGVGAWAGSSIPQLLSKLGGG